MKSGIFNFRRGPFVQPIKAQAGMQNGLKYLRSWHDKKIFLNFGGAHPSATVWLNGTILGENTIALCAVRV